MKKALKNIGIAQFIGLYRKGLKKIGFYRDMTRLTPCIVHLIQGMSWH